MAEVKHASPRGVLVPGALGAKLSLSRYFPGDSLAPFVEHYWLVKWDRRGEPDYYQETLPFPSVHAVVEDASSEVFGVMTTRFRRCVTGVGRGFGIKWRPGAFFPYFGRDLAELTDKVVPLGQVFGPDADDFSRALLAEPDDHAQVALAEAFLEERRRLAEADDDGEERVFVGRLVEALSEIPPEGGPLSVVRVEAIAERFSVGRRTLERLFRRYVGVSPKWVQMRARLHEATSRLAADPARDLTSLAADLGYTDQAHFIRDFSSLVGLTPSRYAARCAAMAGAPGSAASTSTAARGSA